MRVKNICQDRIKSFRLPFIYLKHIIVEFIYINLKRSNSNNINYNYAYHNNM
jgi:hypothetical protein